MCASVSNFFFCFHGFFLFFFLAFLSIDFCFAFTVLVVVVVVVVVTLAAVAVGLTWLLVTGGLGVSLNFLGGGLVGFSLVSSTVTEMAQMSVKHPFSQFYLLNSAATYSICCLL